VLNMLAVNGALADMISAGARILESACGPCIGQGFSPADNSISLRTFNRNFAGRSGTKGDQVYLVSPETAVAAALTGCITDPRELSFKMQIEYPDIELPEKFIIDDSMIEPPADEISAEKIEVLRGPTIVVPDKPSALQDKLTGQILLKCGDKITTDHIMPAGAFLKLRSNVPEYAKVVFNSFNESGKPTFAERALKLKKNKTAGIIVAGESYGQGSSREHAALCPMYLGVRMVIAKSIERIHKANLINFCIVPVEFAQPGDYNQINADDVLIINHLTEAIHDKDEIIITNKSTSFKFKGLLKLSKRDRQILLAGGMLNYTQVTNG
jgi:aconitate hydratase